MVMLASAMKSISNSSPLIIIAPIREFILTTLVSKNIMPLWFSIIISLFPITIILGKSSEISRGKSNLLSILSFPFEIYLPYFPPT